jgi:hypothetical protein
MRSEDRLLEGAIDIHAHGYPEYTLNMPPRVDNAEWARLASVARMRGFVIKSHIWPTADAAHVLRSLYPDLEIFGWNPPAPEILRMFIASMLALGFKEDEVFQMTHDNPARLLGVAPQMATNKQTVAGTQGA